MAAKLQCEICGGKLVGRPGGIYECENCGMEFDTAWAKSKLQEITGTVKVEGTVEVTGKVQVDGGTVQVDNSANKDALLRRGELALEDSAWDKAKELFDKVLNIEAECAEAYLGLAMAEAKSRDRENYGQRYIEANSAIRRKGNSHLTRARQFSKELDEWFSFLDEEGAAVDTAARKMLVPFREKIACPMKMIAVGPYHTVGLRADGTVVAAGKNYDGQCEVGGWTDIVAVAAGEYHTVGLRADGTVVATTYTGEPKYYYGQCEVSEWKDIVAIVAADAHTVGLRGDGTVLAVGLNVQGQCNVSDWTDIVAVAAGIFHTVGLRADGTVVSTGINFAGQCEVGDWTDIIAVAAGDKHTIGLRVDGTVVATDYTGDFEFYHGQCGVSGWTDIVAIATGGNVSSGHTVGLRADGTAVATRFIGNQIHDLGQCDVSNWKLFEHINTIADERKAAMEKAEAARKAAAEKAEAERKAAAEKAEAARKAVEAERKAKKESLIKEKDSLLVEYANLKGLFSGKRRREIDAQIADINTELKKLQ